MPTDEPERRKGTLLQVVCHHPLVAKHLVKMLSADSRLRPLLSSPPIFDFRSTPSDAPRIFILDVHSLSAELSKLVRILRVRYPRSRFLTLLPPQGWTEEEILRLLYLGVEGIVKMTDKLEGELAQALASVMNGGLWAPRRVLAEYVRQTNWLRSEEFLSRYSLTSREIQILQLAMRRFSNKEIASVLRISERTAKFHMSNIFGKLGVSDRQALFSAITLPRTQPLKP
jgi:DNA-binding NarL/FixJ family response regulator